MKNDDPLRAITGTRKIAQHQGGPTTAPYFWGIELECGHSTHRTAHAKIPKRIRCHDCTIAATSTRREQT